MKIKERALAILLSLVMMLTFMPALAFAEDETAEAEGMPAFNEGISEAAGVAGNDLKKAQGEKYTTESRNAEITEVEMTLSRSDLELLETEWYDYSDDSYNYSLFFSDGEKVLVYKDSTTPEEFVFDESGFDEYEYEYWADFKNSSGDILTLWTTDYAYYDQERIEAGSTYYFDASYYGDDDYGRFTIEVSVTAADEDEVAQLIALNETKKSAIKELYAAYNSKYSACRPAQQEELDNIFGNAIGSIDSASSIQSVKNASNNAKAAMSAVKTDAQLKQEEAAAAAAQAAAATEVARQGTYDPSLPKVKISKPAAAKKKFTAKWKKLSKKQLKKGVTNIEIWVCPNTGFGPNDTIIKTTGKKKASAKVKGLAKGTYYVKVRAIKNVGGVKYVGSWSKVKKVKVKK